MSWQKTLVNLLADPKNIGRICEIVGVMPNIEFPVMDMGICWSDEASCRGYKLQRNYITGHYRIINPNKCRIAWGSESEMRRILSRAGFVSV